jgi:hypothetical protein
MRICHTISIIECLLCDRWTTPRFTASFFICYSDDFPYPTPSWFRFHATTLLNSIVLWCKGRLQNMESDIRVLVECGSADQHMHPAPGRLLLCSWTYGVQRW